MKMMLKITGYGAEDYENGVSIGEAFSVRVAREINGAHTLDFKYPENEKTPLLKENKIVICEGQAYRVLKVSKRCDGESVTEVRCSHIWNADAPNIHLQNIPDMIGVSPKSVIERAIRGTKFKYMTDMELKALNMKRVDADGFKIDFFSVDKTNPYDVVKAVIECCGKGELYTDNKKIALVERIGTDTAVRLDLGKNMEDITVERDITDLVTRLYPYGRDDLHIGSVNGGRQYIESANAAVYGVREGYRDFGDITSALTLFERALWEFDAENAERIDVPQISITGTYAELNKIAGYEAEQLRLGDGVTVVDGGDALYERVIKIERYPYSPESAILTIGRVKKDMFFYLEQIGNLARRYKKVSTRSGKVKASAVSGTIKNSGVVSETVTAGTITIGRNVITTDEEGNLLINGERINGENEDEQNI
ncbi:MAG: phage tail protein [Clostridia bacterium]|nr:phage tail protein [Clostridia bacterium]